jgi:hypothetical protein
VRRKLVFTDSPSPEPELVDDIPEDASHEEDKENEDPEFIPETQAVDLTSPVAAPTPPPPEFGHDEWVATSPVYHSPHLLVRTQICKNACVCLYALCLHFCTQIDHFTKETMAFFFQDLEVEELPTPPLPFKQAVAIRPLPACTICKGSFVTAIAVKNSTATTVLCSEMMGKVVTAAKVGKYLQYCELLADTSIVKPYFDIECKLPTKPTQEALLTIVVDWLDELKRCLLPCVPGVGVVYNPMSRHRSTPDGFKVSLRVFVTGVKTTPRDLGLLVKDSRFSKLTGALDASVYSSTRKMSMAFCFKSPNEPYLLQPGLITDACYPVAKSIPFNPQWLSIDPLHYCIQYVDKAWPWLVLPGHHVRPPLALLLPTAPNPVPWDQARPPPPVVTKKRSSTRSPPHVKGGRESKKSTALVSILELCGFSDPFPVGESVLQGSELIVNFDADNRLECPLCKNQHSSNNWYVILSQNMRVFNHSTSCVEKGMDALEMWKERCSTLLRLTLANGPGRHVDYSVAIKEHLVGTVCWDAADSTFYQWTPAEGSHKATPSIDLLVMDYLEGVVDGETERVERAKHTFNYLGASKCLGEIMLWKKCLGLVKKNVGSDGFMKAVSNQVKLRITRDPAVLPDSVDHNLHFRDGVLDLDTGLFRDTVAADDNRNITACGWRVDGWVEVQDEVEMIIKTVLPFDDAFQIFKMMCGYLLSGHTHMKKLFLCCDMKDGNNGKSFLLSAVTNALGSYHAAAARNQLGLMKGGGGAEAPSPQLLSTSGKRVMLVEELGSSALDCAWLKQLSSGIKQKISARQLYGKQASFVSKLKIVMTANKGALKIDTRDQAFVKRLLPIPFDVEFTSDPALVKAPLFILENKERTDPLLNDPRYQCALLHWCYHGYRLLMQNPELLDDAHLSPRMRSFKTSLILFNDPAIDIITTKIMPSTDPDFAEVTAGEVWQAYRQDPRVGRVPLKEVDFYKTLKTYVFNAGLPGAWHLVNPLYPEKRALLKGFLRRMD